MAYKLTKLEALQEESVANEIEIKYTNLPTRVKGLYFRDEIVKPLIALNKQFIENTSEELCIMAEELGHHYTSCGDLLDEHTNEIIIRKQETTARRWAVKRIASLQDIINAFEAGTRTLYEMAEYMDITEEFLYRAIKYYKSKYGIMTIIDDKYIVYFEPFGILKKIHIKSTTDVR